MVGVLLAGAFLAVVFAYFCTEYLLGRLGAQHRMLSAGSQLRISGTGLSDKITVTHVGKAYTITAQNGLSITYFRVAGGTVSSLSCPPASNVFQKV